MSKKSISSTVGAIFLTFIFLMGIHKFKIVSRTASNAAAQAQNNEDEISQLRSDTDGIKSNVDDIESDVSDLKSEVNSIMIRLRL